MVFSPAFPDEGLIYTRKLTAERCLLAIAKRAASHELQPSDKESLSSLEKLLLNIVDITKDVPEGTLTPDDSSTMQLIIQRLRTKKLVSSLPQLREYLIELKDAVESVKTGRKLTRGQTDQLIQFLEILSSSLAYELDTMSHRKMDLAATV